MKKFLMSAGALAVLAPTSAMAASDGTAGAEAVGEFDVVLNVTEAVGVVQFVGLDDLNIPAMLQAATQDSVPVEEYFCLFRSDAGNVNLTVSQENNANPDFVFVNGQVSIDFDVVFHAASGSFELDVANGEVLSVIRSEPSCDGTFSNGGWLRFGAIVRSVPINATVGNHSATLTLTASAQ